jgi:hypothetical protein
MGRTAALLLLEQQQLLLHGLFLSAAVRFVKTIE